MSASSLASLGALTVQPAETLHKSEMVPVKLDLVQDNRVIKESFLWNINDSKELMRVFVVTMCRDLKLLPEQNFVPVLIRAIEEQVTRHQFYVPDEKNIQETRLVIKLDLSVNSVFVRDQFEWDISEPENRKPQFIENFARSLCAELGLGPDFLAKIIFSIHEQIYQYEMMLMEGNDDEVERARLPPVQYAIRTRDEISLWGPDSGRMTHEELQRQEIREQRDDRMRRRYTDALINRPSRSRRASKAVYSVDYTAGEEFDDEDYGMPTPQRGGSASRPSPYTVTASPYAPTDSTPLSGANSSTSAGYNLFASEYRKELVRQGDPILSNNVEVLNRIATAWRRMNDVQRELFKSRAKNEINPRY